MTKRYWGSVSDAHLLAVELTTDNPEKLDNLTAILPQGPEEPFVEYAYDLRNSDNGMMRCTHCHQLHLAGVVINKAVLPGTRPTSSKSAVVPMRRDQCRAQALSKNSNHLKSEVETYPVEIRTA